MLKLISSKYKLQEIRVLMPTGIFTSKDFYQKVNPGETFHLVRPATPDMLESCDVESYTLLEKAEYYGPQSKYMDAFRFVAENPNGSKLEGLLEEILKKPNGCFTDYKCSKLLQDPTA